MTEDDLTDVNDWLSTFDVTMFRGQDGNYRIWGDINRIQDIVDGPSAETLPPGARRDLDEFFAEKVDAKWHETFARMGFGAVDPSEVRGPGWRPDATSEQIDACYKGTYDCFRLPPDQRPG